MKKYVYKVKIYLKDSGEVLSREFVENDIISDDIWNEQGYDSDQIDRVTYSLIGTVKAYKEPKEVEINKKEEEKDVEVSKENE